METVVNIIDKEIFNEYYGEAQTLKAKQKFEYKTQMIWLKLIKYRRLPAYDNLQRIAR